MMRTVILAVSVYLAAWSWGEAQVEVRSGEHPGFTRLVMYFDEPKNWDLGRIENGYGLRLQGEEQTFNLADVFSFIPRSRILDIEEVSGGLNILSSCECHANAYNFRPGVLVLDIKSGQPPEDARFEASLDVKQTAEESFPAAVLPDLVSLTTSVEPAKDIHATNIGDFDPELDVGVLQQNWANLDTVNRHSPLERQLAERLGRALSEQLLTPSAGSQERLLDVADVAAVEMAKPVPEARIEITDGSHEVLDDLENVSVRSAMDPDTDTREKSDFGHCRSEKYFSLAQFDGAENNLQGLSSARAQFLDDLAAPSQASVQLLVKSYLALGFGAEASQVLELYSEAGLQAAIQRSLASLVDRPEMGVAGDLRSQVDCNTDAALWALLAHGTDKPNAPVNEKAIVRTISALPLHLRRHLVPTVSERLRRLGYKDSAAAVRETVLRAEDGPNMSLDLEVVQAEADDSSKLASDGQRDVLINAARPTSSVSELATASLLAELEEAGRFAPDALLLQVASEIHATRGSENGQRMLDAYMTALGRRGLSKPAVDILSRLDRSRFSEAYDLQAAADLFLEALQKEAPSGAFTIGAVDFEKGFDLDRVSTRVRTLVAGRLEQLNLSEQAAAFRPRRAIMVTSSGAVGSRAGSLQNRLADDGTGQTNATEALSGAPGELAWLLEEWSEAEQLLPDGARKRMAARLVDYQNADVQTSATRNDSGFAGQVTLAQTRAVLTRATDLRRDLAELGIVPEG